MQSNSRQIEHRIAVKLPNQALSKIKNERQSLARGLRHGGFLPEMATGSSGDSLSDCGPAPVRHPSQAAGERPIWSLIAFLSRAEPPSSPLTRIWIISCLNWTLREHSVFWSNNRLFPALTNIMLGFLVIMQMDFESNWTFYIKYFKITMTFPSASTDVAPRILIILL